MKKTPLQAKVQKSPRRKYFVYMLECADGTLYTGSTNNIEKRIIAHNSSRAGAKYTRSRRPVVLKYSKAHSSKSIALKKEAALKKMSRTEKLFFIENN